MRHLVTLMLLVIGLIHLLPLTGVLGAHQLVALYGFEFIDANLQLLMRRRAVLFGLLGAFFVIAAFQSRYRVLVFIAAFTSIVSFLILARESGAYSPQVARVVSADIVALICLTVAVVAHAMDQRAKERAR